MNLTLYTIAEDIKQILEAEEWTEEQCTQLDTLNLQLEAKADNVLMFCDNLESAIEAHEKEIARLKGRMDAMKRRRESVLSYLFNCMKAVGRTELDLVTRTAKIQKNPPSVHVTDEAKLPARFFTIIPETQKLDKKALAKALKEGPVAGAELVQSERLAIR